MTEALTELLERTQGATGPDRLLDALLEVLSQERSAQPSATSVSANEDGSVTTYFQGRKVGRYNAHDFTASIDASLALCSRVLPGCDWSVSREEGEHKAHVWKTGTYLGGHEGVASTPALAVVAALLRALIAGDQS